jgi:hypothetical protein
MVSSITPMPDLIPEEEGHWFVVKDIKQDELTPFAKHVLKEFCR